ncbi:hypothetical protein [Staphylococcus equorum]|uniref:hypothetical protein n=1 Tax=Staphylococcus equorum TaxID=246432 RepID=UPI003FD8D344
MSTLIRTESMTAPKSKVVAMLNQMVLEEYASRHFESDMYRGDFGSSIVQSSSVFEDETRNEDKIIKNFSKFENQEFCELEKYIIKYALIGLAGYVAYEEPKVTIQPGTRLNKYEKYIIKYPDSSNKFEVNNIRRFENITSMKNYAREHSNPHCLVGATISKYNTQTGSHTKVGGLYSKTRQYKNKPKALPKKYIKLDELVTVAFGGGCPY